MADSPPPTSLPPPPSPPPTTITTLSDDLLLEILRRLPAVTSLACAAFTCHAFLRAVRFSPAFQRCFRELRAPPLLALFLHPDMCAIVPAAAGKCSDIATAFDGLLQDSNASKLRSDPEISYIDGYALFFHWATDQGAYYSPHSQALNILPKNFCNGNNAILEFYTLSPDDGERPSRVVCVHLDCPWEWARVAVFSSHTMEWQVVLPEMETGTLLAESSRYATHKVINGFVYWVCTKDGARCILALNTTTFRFFRMDLLPPLKVPFSMFELGRTKDGELYIVSVQQCMLSVWLWATDSDGVERFMLHKTSSLRANVSKITECSEEADVKMQPMAFINGFVYLSLIIDYSGDPHSPEWFLSFCLETAEVNLLHKKSHRTFCSVDPYIMVSWPSSLIHGKEDSEAGVTGNISEDDGPMGTEEASPVLFTALQSFKEKLIDDGNSNFAEIDSFLLDDERNSLLNRIATLESGLAAARDHVLRIHTEPNSMNEMELVTSESELAAARDRVLRISTESDSMEGMERVSCWQMCKLMLGRACSRFFTR